MNQELFTQRLREAMQLRGYKQVDLVRLAQVRDAKIGKSQVSQYLSGKTAPRASALAILADILAVPAEWLSGAIDALPDSTPANKNNTKPEGTPMRQFKKSSKLDNVLYDVRGPVVDEAARMEEAGIHVLKLNIGNPAPFDFRTPDEVVYDMAR